MQQLCSVPRAWGRQWVILFGLVGILVVPIRILTAQEPTGDVLELDPFTVETERGPTAPRFGVPTPSFAYYELDELENGSMIYALEFMDRYRELPVPGAVKWAGILHFPWVDGYGRGTLQYICLYIYDDRMYGYNPSGDFDSQERFYVPLRFQDRMDPERLCQLASTFVDDLSPSHEVELVVPVVDESFSDEGESVYAEYEEYEYVEIPAGRIAGFMPSDRGLEPRELVHMVYQMKGETVSTAPVEIGKTPREPQKGLKFGRLFNQPMGVQRDFLVARKLLEPRWAQRVIINYEKDTLFFGEVTRKRQVLLFNIGRSIYAYYPRFGIWKTEARLDDIMTPGAANGKVSYPGGAEETRIQFLSWDEN